MADFYPAASGDDLNISPTAFYGNGNLGLGQASSAYSLYVRFPNITIPNGSTILSATLHLFASGSYSNNTVRTLVYFNNEDSSVAPTDVAGYNALSLTDPVTWDSLGSTSENTELTSPDLATILQAITDREGWASGNALGVLAKNNSSDADAYRYFTSYDSGHTSYYPKLVVTYTEPPPSINGDGTIPSITITAGLDGVVESIPLFALVNCYVDVPHSDVIESLPIFTLTATTVAVSDTAAGVEFDLPVPTASASSLTGEIHQGDIDVPFFTISATLLTGETSQGVVTVPFLTFTGRTVNTGTVSDSLPVVTINAYAHGPLLHTLDESFPLLQIVATLVQQSTAFRCYVMNTENSAITEYDNFPFNSFCTFKGKHLAAGSSGITLLEGNKDLSTDIKAYFNMGINDFDLPNIKKVTDAYLSMKGDGSYYLTVTSDDGAPHDYLLTATSGDRIKNLKTHVGKGKKGRFFELELSNINGADFEFYDMVLNVELLKRNI